MFPPYPQGLFLWTACPALYSLYQSASSGWLQEFPQIPLRFPFPQSKYLYFVETLKDGNRIYLERPANLHNGFDFLINVENINFSTTNRIKYNPSHDNIFNDLKAKKTESQEKYKKLYKLIEDVYNCKEIEDTNLQFNSGYPVDLILKVAKWFFIEQDIRYWNYSGRAMFMSGVPKP